MDCQIVNILASKEIFSSYSRILDFISIKFQYIDNQQLNSLFLSYVINEFTNNIKIKVSVKMYFNASDMVVFVPLLHLLLAHICLGCNLLERP